MTEPPALVIELSLEGRSRIRVQAGCFEDERRLVDWLRSALERREPLDSVVRRWLDGHEMREAA